MKKTTLIIAIVTLILVFFTAWVIGYSFLSNHVNQANMQGFINDCEEFLSSDKEFTSKYGALVLLEAQENGNIVQIKTPETTEYYMDFNCTTNQGVFSIRVYLTYNKVWTYRFVELC